MFEKKNRKRLALNKETLRILNGAEMQSVEGGFKLQVRIGAIADESFDPVCPSIGCTVNCPSWQLDCQKLMDPNRLNIRF